MLATSHYKVKPRWPQQLLDSSKSVGKGRQPPHLHCPPSLRVTENLDIWTGTITCKIKLVTQFCAQYQQFHGAAGNIKAFGLPQHEKGIQNCFMPKALLGSPSELLDSFSDSHLSMAWLLLAMSTTQASSASRSLFNAATPLLISSARLHSKTRKEVFAPSTVCHRRPWIDRQYFSSCI